MKGEAFKMQLHRALSYRRVCRRTAASDVIEQHVIQITEFQREQGASPPNSDARQLTA